MATSSSFQFAALHEAAASAAGGQGYPASTLYVVATPIGNLADLSLRAIHVLGIVDAIACEDTRHSSPFLRHLGIDKPLLPVHEHNEREASGTVLARLAAGERVAYVSDAGTPAVSDPGAVLVAAARTAGFRVVPIPGASSVVTALSAAGDVSGAGFTFAGFLPTKASERSQRLAEVVARPEAQVLFEAPHRIDTLAKALAEACPERTVTICRELTKQFESICSLPAGQMPEWFKADSNRSRGEFVLVLHGVAESASAEAEVPSSHRRALQQLMAVLPLKQAVATAAEVTGSSRNRLYELALQLKAAGAHNDHDVDEDGAPTMDA